MPKINKSKMLLINKYKWVCLSVLCVSISILLYRLYAYDTSTVYVTRELNSAIRSTAMINTIVVDVYGQSTKIVENICNFRIAIIRPYNWLWMNMDFKVYRLLDDSGLLSGSSKSQCLDYDTSTFVRFNDPRTGIRGSANMKTICLPFTRSSLVAYFTATKRVVHKHITVPIDKLVYDDGTLNELAIINYLLVRRIFIIDKSTNE